MSQYALGPPLRVDNQHGLRANANLQKSKTSVAIKAVSRQKLTSKLLDNLESEINILKVISNRNIVALLDCFVSDPSPGFGRRFNWRCFFVCCARSLKRTIHDGRRRSDPCFCLSAMMT